MSRLISTHLTAEQNYLCAEQLIAAASHAIPDPCRYEQLIAAAQVHATLATVSERDNLAAGRTHDEMLAGNHYRELKADPRDWTGIPVPATFTR